MAKLMHLYYYHNLPQNFDQYIKSTATDHHKYVTRSITNKSFYLRRQNLSYGQSSGSFNGDLE